MSTTPTPAQGQSLPDVLDTGDGLVYPRAAALKAAAHLFKAM